MRSHFFGPEPVKIIWLSVAVVSLVLTAMILWAGRPAARAGLDLAPFAEPEIYFVQQTSFEVHRLNS